MRALNPLYILQEPEKAKKLATHLVKCFVTKSLLPDVFIGDLINDQFRQLVDDDQDFQKELTLFKSLTTEEQPRLDAFYWNIVGSRDKYKDLWPFIRKLLTLSHGNATVSYFLL